ncbi:MAG: ATP-binding protein [Lachnospiraceae bacterium]|nr:ATP-binding protein [Lachnospiraceae bacterium]
MEADNAQLVIVYGRRRVGKTFLINEFFSNKFAFKLTGTYGQDKGVQLKNFTAELNRKTHKKSDVPSDWYQAFELMREYLESLGDDQKQVVFFDEMPWLDNQKSEFLPAFEWFWNDWLSTRHNLVFIVCGSATSWMDEKIANNKGGLFNRHTCRLFLKPFKLYEVEEFLRQKKINWSRYDITRCYMVMGGIPYYLSLLDSRLSLVQNVDNLFFRDDGELWDEFDHLYKTLFSNSDAYIRIVEALNTKKSGLTRNEIIKETGLPTNGHLSKVLNNLILSGFVRAYEQYNKKKKDTVYQLADYYTAFYLRFIRDHHGKDEHFWSNSGENSSVKAWEGLTFEQVCKDHVPQIKRKLGISGVLTEVSTWSMKSDDETGRDGAQIDMLIDRKDLVVDICEIKFSVKEYEITKDYDLKLRNKLGTFSEVTNCRKTVQLIMITTYGVKKNMYSGLLSNQVILEDLFIDA